jgi:hypothetical protein
MSSSIFIYTDTSELDEGTFPVQLTEFLEQYGGYEEKSEVAQTAKLLEIDLGALLKFDDFESEEKTWHELGEIKNLVNTFLEKVNASPDFYTQVIYGEGMEMDLGKLMEKAAQKDVEGMMELVMQMQEKPASGYPPDTGYLSSGFLAQDLETLAGQLARIEKDGAKKIRFAISY